MLLLGGVSAFGMYHNIASKDSSMDDSTRRNRKYRIVGKEHNLHHQIILVAYCIAIGPTYSKLRYQ
jgi:hypothetical protein